MSTEGGVKVSNEQTDNNQRRTPTGTSTESEPSGLPVSPRQSGDDQEQTPTEAPAQPEISSPPSEPIQNGRTQEQSPTSNQAGSGAYGPPGNPLYLRTPAQNAEKLAQASGQSLHPNMQYSVLCSLLWVDSSLDMRLLTVIMVLPQFLGQFPKVPEGNTVYKSLLPSIFDLGACVGAIIQGCIADALSRQRSIVWAVGVFTVGSIIQTACDTYAVLVFARLVGGFGVGMLSMVVPLYISEISPPKTRGLFLVLEEIGIVLGIVVSFWIEHGIKDNPGSLSWRLPFGLQIAPGVAVAVWAYFLPYSPRWLSAKGRHQEALEALENLRKLPNDHPEVQKEWMDIRVETKFQKQFLESRYSDPILETPVKISRWKLFLRPWFDCWMPGCWRRTMLAIFLMFFQQFAGPNALIYYSPTFFENMGFQNRMQLLMPGCLHLAQLLGVVTSLWTLDSFGRKPILICGSLGLFLLLVVISVVVSKCSKDWPSHFTESWVITVFLVFYMIIFGASWGPIPWSMPAEIFPSPLRAKGVAFSTSSHWLWSLVIGLFTPSLLEKRGYLAYVFFTICCGFSLLFVYFVKETKGRTLEEMDELFKDRGSDDHVKMKTQIRNEIEAESREVVH